MSSRSTEDLVQDLAHRLTPVQPVVRLRVAGASVLLAWCFAVVASWLLGGGVPTLASDWPRGDLAFWSILLGLAIAAIGALLAALGSAVPGREGATRAGRVTALAGFAWLFGAGLLGFVDSRIETPAAMLAGSSPCLLSGLALGLPSVLIACLFLSRGVAPNLRIAVALAASGSAALGAFAVHAICPVTSGYHVMLGHCLAPIVGAALLAVPLAALMARWSPPAR